jgi:hypothetical protein
MRGLDRFVESLSPVDPITDFETLFDDSGKIREPQLFRERLYHNRVDSRLRGKLLPFAVGLYDLDSTSAERARLDEELNNEFAIHREQVNRMTKNQLQNNKRLADAYRVIAHDVTRTDRQLLAFRNHTGAGGTMLTTFLQTFAVYNPPLGYLQGMNDLFVPIIMTLVPDWSENGDPTDHEGNAIDIVPLMPHIFWCFDAMLRNTGHSEMLANVTEHCPKQAARVHQLIAAVSPLAAIWMRRCGLKDLLWCYSDFVLLFKRTYAHDVWPVWFKFNCAPVPKQWLAYFMAAILIGCFEQLTELRDVQITAMMDSFPRILNDMDPDRIGKIALWLYATAPLPVDSGEHEDNLPTEFDFFETKWSEVVTV